MDVFGPLNSRILVPLDGSEFAERAIPVAEGLASPGSTIILCRIVGDRRRLDDGGVLLAADAESDRSAAESSLQSVADRFLSGAGFGIELVVAEGDPADGILATARDRGAGLIVMSSHGRGAGLRQLFGSVADEVMRQSPLPVVVVHPSDDDVPVARASVRRLVVTVDDSALSQQAAQAAVLLAKRRRLPVLLVSAVDPSQTDSPIAGAVSDRAYHNVLGALKHEALHRLESTGARLMREGVVATWRLLSGPPARVIPAVLVSGDLVVMASNRLEGVERWWRGSLAEELVRSGAAPVMVVGARPIAEVMEPQTVVEPVSHA